MDFSKVHCDCCGELLDDASEIVTCPICGTPQHRACFEARGGCVNQDKHESGFEFIPPRETVQEQPAPQNRSRADENVQQSLSMGELPDVDDVVEQRIEAICPGITDEQRKESLCGQSVAVTASFIGNNAARYVDKFRKIEHGEGKSFNWAAFLFAPYWFFFRKQYKFGAIYAAVLVLLNSVITFLSAPYVDLVQTFMENGVSSISEAEFSDLTLLSSKLMLIYAIIFAINLAVGFFADKIYYKYCTRSLSSFSQVKKNEDNEASLKFYLKKSSTSVFAPAVCMAAIYLVTYLLSYFIA